YNKFIFPCTERRDSINAAVSPEIISIFKGKTPKQLQAMYRQIEKKISKSEDGVDISYWETLLSRLNAYMARARLRERHEENLRHKLYKLKKEQGVEPQAPLFPCVAQVKSISEKPEACSSTQNENSCSVSPVSDQQASTFDVKSEKLQESSNLTPNDSSCVLSSDDTEKSTRHTGEDSGKEPEHPVTQVEEVYDSGRYSPILISFHKLEPSILITDPYDDFKRLEFMRKHHTKLGDQSNEDILTAEEKAFDKIARKGMDADEASFSVEYSVDRSYLWGDKYRPRKPRYFNRVHTGFEWNKYNQTHYDMDNPPPKIVQGYKFNIFYPDLIDKSKTPEYSLVSKCNLAD
ncbi:cactin-like, partial [Stegodyphus dumicola]|uniref:cactin-like n=1 Tax=Stegodyphus dumicola TaxID=202533 RepID=UPI0015B1899F